MFESARIVTKDHAIELYSATGKIDDIEILDIVASDSKVSPARMVGRVYVQCKQDGGKRSKVWQIQGLHIDPSYRRLGIATMILTEVLLLAAVDEECVSVALFCKKTNEDAIALYEKMGFVLSYEWDEEYAYAHDLNALR